MATRFVFTPLSAEFPSANYPQITLVNRRPALGYNDTTAQGAYWTAIAPVGLTGAITLVVFFAMVSATTGNVIFRGYMEAISSGDVVINTASATNFGSPVSSGSVAVPGTAGFLGSATISMGTGQVSAGQYFRMEVDRDAANASDTATGNANVYAVEFRDAA